MGATALGSYGLQVGAFAVKANAEKLRKRLEEKGYAVTVRQASPRVPQHRVLVGTYPAKADADAQREKVVEAGAKGAKVVPAGSGKFTVEAGTFRNLDAAIDLARELQKSGLAPRIDSRPTATGISVSTSCRESSPFPFTVSQARSPASRTRTTGSKPR